MLLVASAVWGQPRKPVSSEKFMGLYIHQHWPYHHPYAARTWTLEDWRGYADGLKKLGYNAVMIWPMLETMPDPLTASDRASLEKHRAVIDMLHHDFAMTVWIALCPNVTAKDRDAAKADYETRHFFYSDVRVNPADPAAVRKMIQWRERLLLPLAQTDAVAIIDSDPGGYPGSTNAEFVNLLIEHRRMFDRLRPGIALVYWMHAGWPAYGRFYSTGKFVWGRDEEFQDALERLKKDNPEPWGLAGGLRYAERAGLISRAVILNYGKIESEPSFPTTNFGNDLGFATLPDSRARGVMGNAQTHCVQLPNTFAFVRAAKGLATTRADYVRFADELIPGDGSLIVRAWESLTGKDAASMRQIASELEHIPAGALRGGPLKGLLFGDPHRFMQDLVMQLRLRAAAEDFYAASEANRNVKESLGRFIEAAEVWQRQSGYENNWNWPRLNQALRKLNSSEIDKVLSPTLTGATPFERVRESYSLTETYTPRLLAAMKAALKHMSSNA